MGNSVFPEGTRHLRPLSPSHCTAKDRSRGSCVAQLFVIPGDIRPPPFPPTAVLADFRAALRSTETENFQRCSGGKGGVPPCFASERRDHSVSHCTERTKETTRWEVRRAYSRSPRRHAGSQRLGPDRRNGKIQNPPREHGKCVISKHRLHDLNSRR